MILALLCLTLARKELASSSCTLAPSLFTELVRGATGSVNERPPAKLGKSCSWFCAS